LEKDGNIQDLQVSSGPEDPRLRGPWEAVRQWHFKTLLSGWKAPVGNPVQHYRQLHHLHPVVPQNKKRAPRLFRVAGRPGQPSPRNCSLMTLNLWGIFVGMATLLVPEITPPNVPFSPLPRTLAGPWGLAEFFRLPQILLEHCRKLDTRFVHNIKVGWFPRLRFAGPLSTTRKGKPGQGFEIPVDSLPL